MAELAAPSSSAAPPPPGHGVGDTSQYYDKWDKLAKEEARKTEAEEEARKAASDAALGLDTLAPKSATEKADREKRKQLKANGKKYEGVELDREKQKVCIEGLRGLRGLRGAAGGEGEERTTKILTAEDFGERRVVTLQDNEDCRIEFPRALDALNLIKVFVSHCRCCTVVLHAQLMTSTVEIAHCADVVFEVRRPVATFQVDLSERVRVRFGQNTFREDAKARHRLYHSAVRGLTVEFEKDGVAQPALTTGEMDDFALAAKEQGLDVPADEAQFMTRIWQGALTTDRVLRDASNHPTTQRDVDARTALVLQAMRDKGIDPSSDEGQKILSMGVPLDRMARAQQNKDKGNHMFKERDYGQAMLFYSQAITTLGGDRSKGEEEEEEEGTVGEEQRQFLSACYSNRAACALKLGQHENALSDAKRCVALDPAHVRGTFRVGLALHALERYREACPVLSKALGMQPGNKQIKTALQFAERKAMMTAARASK